MAESIQEIFFLLDRNSKSLLYISPIAEIILGIPLFFIRKNPWALKEKLFLEDLMHFISKEKPENPGEEIWHSQAIQADFRFIRPDDKIIWLRIRTFLIKDSNGKVYRIAGVLNDITEFKNAQEEAKLHQQKLIQVDKMNSLGQMVSGVAHEINNPNNLIMLNADVMESFWNHIRPVLREYSRENENWKLAGIPYAKVEGKYETLLSGIVGGSQRIKRIVENLRDFGRVDSGEISETLNLGKVVQAALTIVDSLIQKSTTHFSVHYAENLPNVKGNFQKLEQVVINLLTNACQALDGPEKAIRIEIFFETESHQVVLKVEDEGIGIPSHLLHKIADPFFTTRRDSGGTGLGLSVSYGIIREHRGTIEFKSKEKFGTTVEIRIPTLLELPNGSLS